MPDPVDQNRLWEELPDGTVETWVDKHAREQAEALASATAPEVVRLDRVYIVFGSDRLVDGIREVEDNLHSGNTGEVRGYAEFCRNLDPPVDPNVFWSRENLDVTAQELLEYAGRGREVFFVYDNRLSKDQELWDEPERAWANIMIQSLGCLSRGDFQQTGPDFQFFKGAVLTTTGGQDGHIRTKCDFDIVWTNLGMRARVDEALSTWVVNSGGRGMIEF